ncbi:MAG: c-type cytochrome [Rhodocyclaceae bacterium]|nr:c-type cytochrome [Rhodocyclaceae bacterium]
MNRTLRIPALALAILGCAPFGAAHAQNDKGKAIYDKVCVACHSAGIAGAPKLGDAKAWEPRIKAGIDALYESALKGKAPAMPAKGGATDVPDADIKAAVDYMVAAAKDGASAPAAAAAAPAAQAAPAAPTTPRPAALSFNRLLKPASKRNPPPPEDGIHDPDNDGTHALQPPLQVFESLPRSNAGNRVDWVKALDNNLIAPRWDRTDPAAAPVVMDLNIVREVKGSMPDVVYPHKQHTAWLDCSNCHPQIFIPQKGANQISMAAILLGQKCGVCHGKVAFPVSECRICHSKKKNVMPVKNAQAN